MKEYKVFVCKESMIIKDNTIKKSDTDKLKIEVHDHMGLAMSFNLRYTMLNKVDTKDFDLSNIKVNGKDRLVAEVDTLGIVIEDNDDMIKALYLIIKTFVRNSVGPSLMIDSNVLVLMTVNKFTKNLLVNNADKLNVDITVTETDSNDKYLVTLSEKSDTSKEIVLPNWKESGVKE